MARGRPHYDSDGTLYVQGRFASTPAAQEVRQLVKEGIIDAMSVMFGDAQSEYRNGVRHITKAELLAVDLVTVPANQNTLILSAKSAHHRSRAALELELMQLELDMLELGVA